MTTERTFWYHRAWGLWAIGVSVALVNMLGGYIVQHLGGGAWGALISFFGVAVLSWAGPARDRPRRAAPAARPGLARREGLVGPRGVAYAGPPVQVVSTSRAATSGIGPRSIPLLGYTPSATWALTQHELLREQNRLLADQNRLLAGLPPLPR